MPATNGNTKHGHAPLGKPTPEYMAWQNMIQRCTNPNFRQYDRYGGRGIRVAEEWLGPGGFEAFLAAVGPRPSSTHSLDREKNDIGYQPGNVRWATREMQNRNTSKNVFLEVDGRRQTVAEWVTETGLPYNTIKFRMQTGLTGAAVVDPVRRRRTKTRAA